MPTSLSPTSKETDVTEGTQFYYNLTTGTVEEGHQSPGTELMGPYATREEAARALQTAAERNKSWDEENAEWEGYGSEGSGSDGSR
ncbi:MAG: SPOR domain-containing protein [Brachybacterium sp.]|nr:SPOR domain-containing protein [Brachybacterium sp.]